MHNIKTILFDLDNTLINRQQAAYERMKHFVKQFEEFKDYDEMELEAVVQHFILLDENGSAKKSEMFERLQKQYKLNIDPKDLGARWDESSANAVYPFDDCLDTLTYLKEKGYKLGIITNGNAYGQYQKAINTGVSHLMDEIIVAGAVGISKPNKEVYEITLEKMNTKAEECAFVGDTFHTDIIGAYRCGITPIWYCTDPLRPCDIDIIRITSLTELKDIF